MARPEQFFLIRPILPFREELHYQNHPSLMFLDLQEM